MHKVVTLGVIALAQDVWLWKDYGEMEQYENNLDLQYTLAVDLLSLILSLGLPIRILVISTTR